METVIRLRYNYNTAHFVFCNSLNKCFLCCRYLNTSKILFVTKSLLPSWYKTPAEEARWPTPTSWRQIRENNKILSEAVLARPQDSHEVHWLAAAAVSAGQARAEEGDQRLLPRPRPQVGEPQQLPPPRPGQPPQQAQPLALPRARGLLADLARHGETLAQVDEDKEWRCDLQQQRSQQRRRRRGARRRQWLRWVSNCTANALYLPDIFVMSILSITAEKCHSTKTCYETGDERGKWDSVGRCCRHDELLCLPSSHTMFCPESGSCTFTRAPELVIHQLIRGWQAYYTQLVLVHTRQIRNWSAVSHRIWRSSWCGW